MNKTRVKTELQVEVVFAHKKLKKCYLDQHEAQRTWGPDVARRYIQRIDILQEAETMDEIGKLPGLSCHPLKGRRKGRFAITLQGRCRLEFSLREERATIIRIEEVSRHYGD